MAYRKTSLTSVLQTLIFHRLLLPLCFLGSTALYAGDSWQAITTEKHKNCTTTEKYCHIEESNAMFAVNFIMKESSSKFSMETIEIWNLADKSKQVFKIDEMNEIGPDEYYELYKVSFRPGIDKDLGLHAYDSAREGEMYYYFLYDASKKKFVMSKEPFPKLIHVSGKDYKSDLQGRRFELGSDLHFHQK
jgi:hypothetical protein